MTRTVTGAFATALAEPVVRPVAFIAIDFPSAVARLCTVPFPKTWSGYTWGGFGDLLSIDVIEEDAALSAPLVRVGLSGLDPTLAAAALTESYRNREMQIWCGLADADHDIVADPVLAWEGLVDNAAAEFSDSTAAITVTGKHFLDIVFQPRGGRFNNADQQARYPGDKFFEYLERMQTATIVWGYPLDARTGAPNGQASNVGIRQASDTGYQASNVGIRQAGDGGRDRSTATRGYS